MKLLLLTSSLIACSVGLAHAGGAHAHAAHQTDAIVSTTDENKVSSFDILAAHVHRNDRTVTFHMTTAGQAGQDIPLILMTHPFLMRIVMDVSIMMAVRGTATGWF